MDAVAQGGVITFDCGPDPVTVTLDRPAKVFNDASTLRSRSAGEALRELGVEHARGAKPAEVSGSLRAARRTLMATTSVRKIHAPRASLTRFKNSPAGPRSRRVATG